MLTSPWIIGADGRKSNTDAKVIISLEIMGMPSDSVHYAYMIYATVKGKHDYNDVASTLCQTDHSDQTHTNRRQQRTDVHSYPIATMLLYDIDQRLKHGTSTGSVH